MRKSKYMTEPRFAHAVALLRESCTYGRRWDALMQAACEEYGDHGPLISGCGREHFPNTVKDQLRALARLASDANTEAYAARPSRVRMSTMRALARDVATYYGSGRYGPSPWIMSTAAGHNAKDWCYCDACKAAHYATLRELCQ